MVLNLKNAEVDRFVEEIVRATGESKTEAVRRALAERRLRLGQRAGLVSRGTRIFEFLQSEVWPMLPEGDRTGEPGPGSGSGPPQFP